MSEQVYRVHYTEDHLMHYGIKGMKWGVRKDRYSGEGDLRTAAVELAMMTAISLTPIAATLIKRPLSTLSDRAKRRGRQIVQKITKKGNSVRDVKNPKQAMKNLNYKEINPVDGDMNCTACSVSTCLRLKGVKATAKKIGPQHGDRVIRDCFKGSVTEYVNRPTKDRVVDHILKTQPDGSYGIVNSPFSVNGRTANIGHSFNYLVDNGKVKFIDNQSDCDMNEMAKYMSAKGTLGAANITRLNDCDVNFKKLKRYVDVHRG